MRWNWQQPDWPNFLYDPAVLRDAEPRFLKNAGVIVGAMLHVDAQEKQALTIDLIAQETLDTSAIEGELLDRASVQSSLARHFGLRADGKRATPAEAGAAELMARLYQSYHEPLSDQMLFDWHAMLMRGRRDLGTVGGYRCHSDPMQIVSGALHAPRVHFEAPPSARVPEDMQMFIAWFNASAPRGATPLAAIARAGLAHLWFESIHPFEDGNGRIGRAISEKALAQSVQAPTMTALAETIYRHRKDYYAKLAAATGSNQVTGWMSWFAQIVLEAQTRTVDRIRFVIAKTRLLERLQGRINPRQERALLRLVAAGPDGFTGGLSAGNYQRITGAPTATTTRDLAELVALGALRRQGERKSTRYYLLLDQ
jgi:Fic family protein